jgi:hypothetical protein
MKILKIRLIKAFLICFALTAFFISGNAQSFSNLKTYNKYGKLRYDHTISEIIDKKEESAYEDIYVLLKTKIDRHTKAVYLIKFDYGPSEDPSFTIFLIDDTGSEQLIGNIPAEELVIPGNGYVYSAGKANQLYDKRQKFRVNEKGISEIKQAAYYIGLKTQTNKPITLWADKNKSERTAVLPANYDIEVLIEQENWFLIRTAFGLSGWLDGKEINTYDMSGENLTIKGLFYMGD